MFRERVPDGRSGDWEPLSQNLIRGTVVRCSRVDEEMSRSWLVPRPPSRTHAATVRARSQLPDWWPLSRHRRPLPLQEDCTRQTLVCSPSFSRTSWYLSTHETTSHETTSNRKANAHNYSYMVTYLHTGVYTVVFDSVTVPSKDVWERSLQWQGEAKYLWKIQKSHAR